VNQCLGSPRCHFVACPLGNEMIDNIAKAWLLPCYPSWPVTHLVSPQPITAQPTTSFFCSTTYHHRFLCSSTHHQFPMLLLSTTSFLCNTTYHHFPLQYHPPPLPSATTPTTSFLCSTTYHHFPLQCHLPPVSYATPPTTSFLCSTIHHQFPLQYHLPPFSPATSIHLHSPLLLLPIHHHPPLLLLTFTISFPCYSYPPPAPLLYLSTTSSPLLLLSIHHFPPCCYSHSPSVSPATPIYHQFPLLLLPIHHHSPLLLLPIHHHSPLLRLFINHQFPLLPTPIHHHSPLLLIPPPFSPATHIHHHSPLLLFHIHHHSPLLHLPIHRQFPPATPINRQFPLLLLLTTCRPRCHGPIPPGKRSCSSRERTSGRSARLTQGPEVHAGPAVQPHGRLDSRLNLGSATTRGLLLHGGFGFYEDCGGECCMETVAMRGNECSSSSSSSRETAQDLHRDLKSMQGHLSSHAVCADNRLNLGSATTFLLVRVV
jgi:hypothetical protein